MHCGGHERDLPVLQLGRRGDHFSAGVGVHALHLVLCDLNELQVLVFQPAPAARIVPADADYYKVEGACSDTKQAVFQPRGAGIHPPRRPQDLREE